MTISKELIARANFLLTVKHSLEQSLKDDDVWKDDEDYNFMLEAVDEDSGGDLHMVCPIDSSMAREVAEFLMNRVTRELTTLGIDHDA